jgi:nucleoside-diphosphate-sugar epimerase
MRFAVTGASGRLGRAVVNELLGREQEVVPIDRQSIADAAARSHAWRNQYRLERGLPAEPMPELGPDPLEARRLNIDLNDYPSVLSALEGVEVIIHLGAYPGFGSGHAAQAHGYANNVNTTYNVFEAAAERGIRRVVYASSIQAYGCCIMNTPSGVDLTPPDYLPVDESHPRRPTTPYGLSKSAGEDIAMMFIRRHPEMIISALRYTSISEPKLHSTRKLPTPQGLESLLRGALMTYIPPAEAARCTVLAALREGEGFEAFNVAAPVPTLPWDHELIARVYGSIPRMPPDLSTDTPLFCAAKAQRLLGFRANVDETP